MDWNVARSPETTGSSCLSKGVAGKPAAATADHRTVAVTDHRADSVTRHRAVAHCRAFGVAGQRAVTVTGLRAACKQLPFPHSLCLLGTQSCIHFGIFHRKFTVLLSAAFGQSLFSSHLS